jgi:exopolysaccharide biosynthesis polyprenyl glycosylphosphotransferase
MLGLGSAVGVALNAPSGAASLLLLQPPLALALLQSRGRYRPRLRDCILDSVAPVFGAISIASMVTLSLAMVWERHDGEAGLRAADTWLASLLLVISAGSILTILQRRARKRGGIRSLALIVGAGAIGVDIARRLEGNPDYGLKVVGFLDSTSAAQPDGAPPMLGRLEDLGTIAEQWSIGHVLVAFPRASERELLTLVERCAALRLETTIVPRLPASVNGHSEFEYLGAVPLLRRSTIDVVGWRFATKHAIDRIVAPLLLALLSPLLLPIAVAVRLSSPGPILYGQLRAGRDGGLFRLLKFRTMLVEAGEEFSPVPGLAPGGIEGRDRRTRIGRLLRRTSLDELPQLINVMRGEMSLIGPRPERPEYAEEFGSRVARYRERHRVKAGITGLAQVHGLRGQTSLGDRIELDNFYIEHWSHGLDLKVLLLTIPAVLRGPAE